MKQSILRDFADPPSCYRGKPFWAWNGRLDPAELRRQIRIMHRMGLGGFFMHSRVGLDTPYLGDEWFQCIDACIDEAGKLGMEAWLYDEDRWPSGAAGGLVTSNPQYRQRSLEMRQYHRAAEFRWTSDTLAAFTAHVDGNEIDDIRRLAKGARPARLGAGQAVLAFNLVVQEPSSWYNDAAYLDTMNHRAVREFIRVTHEVYRKKCGRHFGKVVPGIFTDEPNYGRVLTIDETTSTSRESGSASLPWTGQLPEIFRKRYGYDVLDYLPEIYLNVRGRPITPARWNYFDCITHLFVDAFARQIGQWCDRNGLLHTGHVLFEESPSNQTSVVGSCMRFYEHMQAPGMDVLTEYAREYDTAKQVSSAARQFGCKWRLTETYGCTGWQFPLAGHKALGDWQMALGINLRCQHLSWYTMQGQAKRDYPASIFYQSPWWQAHTKVEDYFARVAAVMTRGSEVRDVLVIHPVESMWVSVSLGWRHDKRTSRLDRMLVDLRDSLLAANMDFDYGDEEILSRLGKVTRSDGTAALKLGKASYKAVVVPPLLTIRSSTVKLLKRFRRSGGTVVFAGEAAGHVDASPSGAAVELAGQCLAAPAKGKALAAAVENCRRVSIADGNGEEIGAALYLLRSDDEAVYLFVCNSGHDFANDKSGPDDIPVSRRRASFPDVRIRGMDGCRGEPLEFDATTGEIFAADARRSGDGWEIRTSLAVLGSRLFVVPKSRAAAKAPRRRTLKDVRKRSLGRGPWDIVLSECNNVVLDRPRCRIGGGGGKWRKADDILRIDHAVRDALGIARRGEQMVQPWAKKQPANPPSRPVALSYSFAVTAVPSGDLHLAVERPDLFDIRVNGRTVSTDVECGWWVDRSLRKIPIEAAGLKRGINEITLTCNYDENHPGLETIYLLGSFGVKISGTETTIVAQPRQLKVGNWCRQSLPFYSGAVCYRKTVRGIKLSTRERLFVRVDGYEGAAVRILAGGREAGIIAWQPNEIDVTDFVSDGLIDLGIEVISHRRNSHGPLHLTDKNPRWLVPPQFMTTGSAWSDSYQLVPCGLTVPPVLVVRR